MAAYYNEYDPAAAACLRELIEAGEIAPGVVDERSISDVRPDELRAYTQCHFFAGIGVWSRALRDAGWSDDRPVWTGSCPCQDFYFVDAGSTDFNLCSGSQLIVDLIRVASTATLQKRTSSYFQNVGL